MKFLDVLALSLKTVRSNKLRTGITVAIIAFGIMALVGIITAIQAMNNSLRESFSTMGANAFSIRFRERRVNFGPDRDVEKTSKHAGKVLLGCRRCDVFIQLTRRKRVDGDQSLLASATFDPPPTETSFPSMRAWNNVKERASPSAESRSYSSHEVH